MVIGQDMAGEIVVLTLSGAFTISDGQGMLKDKIHSLTFEGHKQIALDLGGLSYLDSSGLGEMVSAYTTVSRAGGQIKIFNLTKRVSDLLSITKLLTVFDSYDSKEEALRSFTAA